MNRPLAGARRGDREVLTVDYADVLRQAVENERWKILREVRMAIAAVPFDQPKGGSSWERTARPSSEVKKDMLAALDRIEKERM